MDIMEKITDLRAQKKALKEQSEALYKDEKFDELDAITDKMETINKNIQALERNLEASRQNAEPIDGQYDGILHDDKTGEAKDDKKGLKVFASLGDQLKVQKRFDESEWTSYAPSEDELVERTLKKFRSSVRGMNSQAGFEKVKKSFYDMVHQREQLRDQANDEITHVLDFISRVFGENSEMEILLNSLNTSESAIRLMAETGNPTYLDHKKNIFGGLSKASLNRKMKKEA